MAQSTLLFYNIISAILYVGEKSSSVNEGEQNRFKLLLYSLRKISNRTNITNNSL